jgi:serine/threonine-protein kinase
MVAFGCVPKLQVANVQLPEERALDGRYRLDAEIGKGALGVVYRATHAKLDKAVAIKLLHAHCGSDRVMLARFEREAKALAALEHPNVVLVTDYGVENGSPYLVMELLEGQTLAERMADGALDESVARDLAFPLLQALAYVHASGLVHRDVKPSNVFLQRLKNGAERLKLLDFGLAKFMLESPDAEPGMTRTGAVLGTPAYMSPEQASGEPADARSDVYAAGVLILEMLAGRTPFEGDAIEQIRSHLLLDVPPLVQLNPSRVAHPALDAFFARALAKRPSDRFVDATNMLAALEALPSPWFSARAQTGAGTTGTTIDASAATVAQPAQDYPEPSQTTDGASAPPQHVSGKRSRGGHWIVGIALSALGAWGVQHHSQWLTYTKPVTRAAGALVNAFAAATPTVGTPTPTIAPRTEGPAAPPDPSEGSAQLPPPVPDDEELHDTSAQAAPSGLNDDPTDSQSATSSPRPPARNPWRRALPRELRDLRAAIASKSTRKVDQAIVKLHRYNREHPDDVRGFLLLANVYAKRDWSSDAVSQYQIAYRIDPSSRGAPEILPSVVDMVRRGFATNRAGKFIEVAYREDALSALARAQRLHHDDARAVARLSSLQTRISGK